MSLSVRKEDVWVKKSNVVDLPWFKQVLRKWCALNRRYCKSQKDDAAYWTTERANLGVLAVAAWMVGGVALEEFAVDGKKKSNGKRYRGRVDLWIADKTGKEQVTIEAKHAFINAATGADDEKFVKKVKASLDGARRSVAQTEIAGTPAAVTFVVPWFRDAGAESRRRFQVLAGLCRHRLDPEFIATYLHDCGKPPMEKGQHYLGVILVGRSHRRRPRG